MKAMILAAGKGTRMQPLTKTIPKPLIEVHGKPLIVHHIERLAQCGITDIIINIAYMGKKIMHSLGNGAQFGVDIHYSIESEGPLETGGGIVNALPLLGDAPFMTINADIYTDFNLATLSLAPSMLVNLVLVPNPSHNLDGDFSLSDRNILVEKSLPSYTYAGMALFDPSLFKSAQVGKYSVVPFIQKAMTVQKACGQLHTGLWQDVGTPQRLQKVR